jgi:nucleotide-binding universal stress UspA family protein
MKTILAPTDLSKISMNAIDYAAELAIAADAKLILFHAYHVPVITTDLPIVLPSLDDLAADSKTGLESIQNQLHAKHGHNLQTSYEVVCGFAADTIEKYCEKNNVDFIVMGLHGAGFLEEKLIGSVTTSVIHNTKFPVLVIGEKVKYSAPKKIVLASDFKEVSSKTFQPLRKLTNLFDSHIMILNIAVEAEMVPSVKEAVAGIKLDHSLEGTIHSFHSSENTDVIEGLNDFIIKHDVNMAVMVHHKYSFIERVFSPSKTKKMAFHSSVPLLTLPDKK